MTDPEQEARSLLAKFFDAAERAEVFDGAGKAGFFAEIHDYDGDPEQLLQVVSTILEVFAVGHPAAQPIADDFLAALGRYLKWKTRRFDEALGLKRRGKRDDRRFRIANASEIHLAVWRARLDIKRRKRRGESVQKGEDAFAAVAEDFERSAGYIEKVFYEVEAEYRAFFNVPTKDD